MNSETKATADLPANSSGDSVSVRHFFSKGLLASSFAFGSILAWNFLSIAVLSPLSANLVISPLSCCYLAGFVTLLIMLRLLITNSIAFSSHRCRNTGVTCLILGTIISLLLGVVPLPLPIRFVLSIGLGACMSLSLGAVVYPISLQNSADRMISIMMGIAIAGFLEMLCSLVLMHFSEVHVLGPFVLGILAAIGLALWQMDEDVVDPITYRPSASQHYRMLSVACILYVFVFGSVMGSSANSRGMSGASSEAESDFVTAIALMVTVAIPIILSLVKHRVSNMRLVGRILTPVMAALFLAFLVFPDSVRHYLPALTMAFWQIVEAYIILLIIDISRSGVASISLVFSAGWGIVCCGAAIGVIFGQSIDLAIGSGEQSVSFISIFHTIVAVIASSIVMGARFPAPPEDATVLPMVGAATPASGEGDVGGGSLADGRAGGAVGREEVADEAEARDEVGAACDRIVERFALSEREAEVCELLTRGNTRAGIASRLFVSENTVRTHVKNIYSKLHIHSKQQLIDLVDAERKNPGSVGQDEVVMKD